MRARTIVTITVGLAMAASAALFAAVTFDPETGEGFVGKGDVQRTLGWNNGQFQANADSLVFTYAEQVTQTITCTQSPSGQTRTGTRTRTIGGQLAYDNRKVQQVSGIFLTGYTDEETDWGPWVPNQAQDLPGACFNEGGGWDGELSEPVSTGDAELLVNGVPLVDK